MRKTVLVFLVPFIASLLSGQAAPAQSGKEPGYLKAAPEDLSWWREARFGMFIHWGPVSLRGTEIGWSRGGERRGRPGERTGEIPVEIYDSLYRQFNPVEFNAAEWVSIAQNAGMKYLVFTSKHHDGFSMFDSRLTDYTITRSPFRRDVVKELADACHRAGIRLGFYYSPVDWRQVERLQEMGAWLRKYGESVYGTRGGPFPPGKWGASTHRGNTVYLHLMNDEDETVILPPLEGKIVSRVCMTGGRIQVKQTGAGTEISIAPNARNSIDTLVKLTLDGVR